MLGAAGVIAVGAILAGVLRGRAARPEVPGSANGETAAAGDVQGSCSKSADPCACILARAARARDDGVPKQALAAIAEADADCASKPAIKATKAETLAAEDRIAEAEPLAGQVLATDPKERAARRARAYAAISRRDFAAADALLGPLLAEEPNDLSATFAVALSNARRNRYNPARQGFITVTRKNRKHVEARYQLVLLTANERIVDEAKHHLTELRAIAPVGDERLARANQALAVAMAPGVGTPVVIQGKPAPSK